LNTISIGFEQAEYDEAELAYSLAHFIGTEHHAVTFTAGDFDDYPQVMVHLEEPQASATALPIYKLYQTCRRSGLTVVLTGEGADELLGGYHWHRGDALVRPLLALPESLRQVIAASPLPMSVPARRVLARGAKDIPTRYRDWLEIGGDGYRQHLLSGDASGELRQNGATPWAEILLAAQTDVPLHQTLWLESQTRMADFINFEVDKMSMASSVEARVPYLDHVLWEFCATLPAHYKLKGGMEKSLLRRAAQHLLPEATRTRRKKGLASPYAQWLRAERLPDWAETALSPAALRQAGLFNPATVQNLRQAHQAGQPNLGALLMGVLSTQVWHDCFIK
jgi:asparagine synthase (glutamine-hydrolysing)